MRFNTKIALGVGFVAACAAITSCNDYDADYNVSHEVMVKNYETSFVKQFGQPDPTHDWGFGTGAKANKAGTRAVGDYATPAAFASKAGEVTNPYTVESAPTVPSDAANLNTCNPYNTNVSVEGGKSYYIDTDYDTTIDNGVVEGDEPAIIYVKSGVTVTLKGTTTNAIYKILPGATVTAPASFKGLENWGTLTISADVNEGCYVKNYGTLAFGNELKLEGTLYTNGDLDLKGRNISRNGNLYVDGDLKTPGNFGLMGKLYVSGEWSGNINVNGNSNYQLAAHVGSISTTGTVNLTAGSQLMVEGDIDAASLTLDGADWQTNGAECVVKGAANVTGAVSIASNTKGYFEILNCASYTANASNIWIGCSSDVKGKLELNGNSKMTLANGVYLHASSANFASNTEMTMMSNSFFKVDGNLQLNNADTNAFNGVGSSIAIVKAGTVGANFENFKDTFVGNIGLDFGGWNYETSTGLIDAYKNLQSIDAVTAALSASIPESQCNPGYTPGGGQTPPPPSSTATTLRVMCEDLGGVSDFDFNDVVFDATWDPATPNVVTIQLLAAGGTLPVSVGGEDVKAMFGVDDNVPVNVDAVGGEEITDLPDPYPYTFSENFTDAGTAIKAVPIVVVTADNEAHLIENADNQDYTKANVPQKIAVPQSVQWMKELQGIDKSYKMFATWVGKANFVTEYGKEWYDNSFIENTQHIYGWTGGTTGGGSNNNNNNSNNSNPPAATTYAITVNVASGCSDMGTVSISGNANADGTYNEGTEVTLTATSADSEKYKFVKWTCNGVDYSTNNPLTITMTSNMSLEAEFKAVGSSNKTATVLYKGPTTFDSWNSIQFDCATTIAKDGVFKVYVSPYGTGNHVFALGTGWDTWSFGEVSITEECVKEFTVPSDSYALASGNNIKVYGWGIIINKVEYVAP